MSPNAGLQTPTLKDVLVHFFEQMGIFSVLVSIPNANSDAVESKEAAAGGLRSCRPQAGSPLGPLLLPLRGLREERLTHCAWHRKPQALPGW